MVVVLMLFGTEWCCCALYVDNSENWRFQGGYGHFFWQVTEMRQNIPASRWNLARGGYGRSDGGSDQCFFFVVCHFENRKVWVVIGKITRF